MRKLTLVPTLLVLLAAALVVTADGGHGQSSHLDIDAEMLLSSRRRLRHASAGQSTGSRARRTTTTAPPTTTTTAANHDHGAADDHHHGTANHDDRTRRLRASAPRRRRDRVPGGRARVDSSTLGAPRSGGRGHQGIDMMAGLGTPTVAPVSGRVEHRGSASGGLSWYVYGDDGDSTSATHLSGYANEGAGWVGAGHGHRLRRRHGQRRRHPAPALRVHPGGGRAANPYPLVAAAC